MNDMRDLLKRVTLEGEGLDRLPYSEIAFELLKRKEISEDVFNTYVF